MHGDPTLDRNRLHSLALPKDGNGAFVHTAIFRCLEVR